VSLWVLDFPGFAADRDLAVEAEACLFLSDISVVVVDSRSVGRTTRDAVRHAYYAAGKNKRRVRDTLQPRWHGWFNKLHHWVTCRQLLVLFNQADRCLDVVRETGNEGYRRHLLSILRKDDGHSTRTRSTAGFLPGVDASEDVRAAVAAIDLAEVFPHETENSDLKMVQLSCLAREPYIGAFGHAVRLLVALRLVASLPVAGHPRSITRSLCKDRNRECIAERRGHQEAAGAWRMAGG